MSSLNIKSILATTSLSLLFAGCAVAPEMTDTEKELSVTMDRESFQPAPRSLRDGIETQEPLAQAAFWMREYELNPTDLEATIKLAAVIRKLGNPQRAVEITQTTRALYPRDPYLTAEYAAALIASDRAFEALKPLDEALSYAPAYGRLWSLKGAVLDQQEEFDLARKHYGRALSITPDDPSVMANMGLSFALSGNPRMAEQWLRKASLTPGASQSVRQNLGMVLQLQGKQEEAERYFQQAKKQTSPSLAKLNIQSTQQLNEEYQTRTPPNMTPPSASGYVNPGFKSPPPVVTTQNSPSAMGANTPASANPYANARSASDAARIAASQRGQRPVRQTITAQQKMEQEALLAKLAGNVRPQSTYAYPSTNTQNQNTAPYYPGRVQPQPQQQPNAQYQGQYNLTPYTAPQTAKPRGASRTRR